MTFLESIICILLLYICIYVLVSRVCKCVENCAAVKHISKLIGSGENINLNAIQNLADKMKEMAKNAESGSHKK